MYLNDEDEDGTTGRQYRTFATPEAYHAFMATQ